MKYDIFEEFNKDYNKCRMEFFEFFKNNLWNFIRNQTSTIFESVFPNSNSSKYLKSAPNNPDILILTQKIFNGTNNNARILRETLADNFSFYAIDTMIFLMFIENTRKLSEKQPNAREDSNIITKYNKIYDKNHKLFSEKYQFVMENSDSLDEISSKYITSQILSIIAEQEILNPLNREDSDSGTIFTPKDNIKLICDNALIYYFTQNTNVLPEKIVDLVCNIENYTENGLKSNFLDLTKSESEKIKKLLDSIAILDPACGTGKFLLQIMETIYKIKKRIGDAFFPVNSNIITKNSAQNGFQSSIIEVLEKLHGVDINPTMILKAKFLLILKSLELEPELRKCPNNFGNLFSSIDFNLLTGDALFQPLQIENLKEISNDLEKLEKLKHNYIDYAYESGSNEKISVKTKFNQSNFTKTKNSSLIFVNMIQSILFGKSYNPPVKILLKIFHPDYNYLQNELSDSIEDYLIILGIRDKLDLQNKIQLMSYNKTNIKKEFSKFREIGDTPSILQHFLGSGFFWNIDFYSIQKNGGFDIIIGNPPYVRQENIKTTNYTLMRLNLERILSHDNYILNIETNNWYKTRIYNNIKSILKSKIKLNKRSDLYIYFFYYMQAILNKNSVLGFITSNSWLNIGFGFDFQEYILENTQILSILEYEKKTFKNADINTSIIFLSKNNAILNVNAKMGLNNHLTDKLNDIPKNNSSNARNQNMDERANTTKFIKIKSQKIANEIKNYRNLLSVIHSNNAENKADEIIPLDPKHEIFEINSESSKILTIKQTELYQIGLKSVHKNINKNKSKNSRTDGTRYTSEINKTEINEIDKIYAGSRWGNIFFMGSGIFFMLERLYPKKILKLGDIATITRGITTGMNKYFILTEVNHYAKDSNFITPKNDGSVMVRNGYDYTFEIEKKFLKPIAMSPKVIEKPLISTPKFKDYLLCINPETNDADLKDEGIQNYINYGKNLKIKLPKGQNKDKIVRGIDKVPSLSSKNNSKYGFSIKKHHYADIFIQKIYDVVYKICFRDNEENPADFVINNTFYNISLKIEYKKYRKIILASLLSSLTYFSIELNARRNFGGGALDTSTFDIENIFVVNPIIVESPQKELLVGIMEKIANRKFKKIDSELISDDRKELDNLLLKILDFPDPNTVRAELYNVILRLTNERKKKAKTFKKNK